MKIKKHSQRRRGVVLAETAMVLPATLMMFIGMFVIGQGVYRHNQLAYLAGLGARWASVHGPTYQTAQKVSAPTADDVMSNAVTPHLLGLEPSRLTKVLTWNTSQSPPTVTFTLTYQWIPEAYLSTMSFSGSATQIITY